MPQHHGIGLLCTTRSLGGIELNVLRLAAWLRERGHRTLVIGVDDAPLLERAEAEGLDRLSLGKPPSLIAPGSANRLSSELQRKDIDTLILNATRDLSLGVLTKRASRNTVALVHTQHMQFGAVKTDFLHRIQHARLDAWISPLPWLARQTEEWTTIPHERIHTIPFGIDLAQFQNLPSPKDARRAMDLPQEAFIAGVIGRLDRGKGQEFLIRAAALLRDSGAPLHVLLLGAETLGEQQGYARELHDLTKELRLTEHVHFRGFQEDVTMGYAAMDCFVLTSLSETYGMVTIEAMAAGLPVIGTDSAGTPDIIQHEKTGMLVPPCDAVALAAVLRDLVQNPGLRSSLGSSAHEDAQHRFSHHTQCARIEELLERIHSD